MEPIAIIGLSCLFPGARTPDEFWRNLLAETDSTSLATVADMGVPPETFFNPVKGQRDKFYALRGGYVRDFVFDSSGYQLPAGFLDALDSLFHWPLYVAREALRDSGYLDSPACAQTGVVLGNLSFPTKTSQHLFAPLYQGAISSALQELLQDPQFQLPRLDPPAADSPGSEYGTNSLANALISGYPAAVVAQALGLSSLHLALDAACATSLYSVKLACDYLQAGKADMMLAGAVSCADPFFIKMGFSIFQAYPDNDNSCPLDKTSQGLISGEGAGMFVLKRLADAERDGDKIYAVLRGIGLSNDGKGKHLLTPNPKGQKLAFERAYADAGIAPQEIDYIECHATGTPLGDITELNSMEAFFGAKPPFVGSVKANFGHMLTAAGMGGMLKTILSMAHNRIPATIKVRQPHASQNNLIGARQIVSQAMDWPNGHPFKRAAVSAFGFGGTNAHLVLENKASVKADSAARNKPVALSISGMAAHFGSCASLDELRQALHAGKQLFTSLPPQRWKGLEDQTELLKKYGIESVPPGAYLSDFEMDFIHFKIPPNDADQPIPQQLLMLKVADEALQDAKMKPGGNVAVLIAMDTELALHEFRGRVDLTWQLPAALERAGVTLTPEQATALEDRAKDSLHIPALVNQYTSFIGNIMASRIAALWDFSGPAITLSAAENSVAKALEVAQMLLSSGEVDAVLVGAVDLAGGIEHVLLRQQMSPLHNHAVPPTLGFSQSSTGWLIGEGAGALVLQRADQAQQTYATLESLACAPATADGVALAARTALQAANTRPNEVGYIEVSAGGFPYQDKAEMLGLADAYSVKSQGSTFGAQTGTSETPVMGSVKANLGHTFVAAGMASLIRTALCLSERYFPGTPGWDAPKSRTQNRDYPNHLPFTVAEQAQPWLAAQRVAAVSVLSHDHTCAHFILRASEPVALVDAPRYLATENLRLIPLAASELESLQAQLAELAQAVSLSQAARTAWQNYQANLSAPYRVILLARDVTELRSEATLAQTGVPKALQTKKRWLTAKGSCFTPDPLCGPVAFVYPGAFNSYSNLGADLFSLFPGLYPRFSQITHDPALALRADKLYQRYATHLTDDDRKALDQSLLDDPLSMVASGTSFATLYTLIMRETFGLQPSAALGYSLGEAAMMWALGVWTHGDEAARALRESELFKIRVAGPKLAVREAWNIDPSVPDDEIWCTYVLMAPVEKVAECLSADGPGFENGKPRAFIAIISTPDEVVLAGDPAACKRVIAKLGCHALRAPFDHVIHCEPMRSEYAGFDALHNWPVQGTPDVACYSAANYAPTELTTASIAKNVSTVSCSQVNFPRLVRRVYDDGARIFVELGPHRTCSRWIDTILGDEPHLALNINQKGRSDQAALLRLLAQLAAHHTPIDLSPLFRDVSVPEVKPGFLKRITLGGDRLADTLLTDENRAYFANLPRRTAQPAYPAPDIAAELAPLRRDWQTLMANSLLSNPGIPMIENKLIVSAPVSPVFLAPGPQTLSPELLKLLENYQPKVAPPPFSLSKNGRGREGVRPSNVIWDQADLIKYAEGNIADVFGPEYALIDTYSRRVRLPMPPYLLVDRITKLNAKLGEYKPSQMTTEYDIPLNAWYSVDGQIPWAVAVESGQCDLMLISYLGIDFENKGHLVYRLLDCTLTFLDDLPKEGQTLRYDISINSFARSGDNLLFFFSYDCYADSPGSEHGVGERMVLKMRGGCAGFFSDDDLARGKGIILTEAELAARAATPKQHFAPLLTSLRSTFGQAELRALTAGDLTSCFGPQYAQPGRNPSLRLPAGNMLMIDRVIDIETDGGPWGLGSVTAEHDLAPDNWYFPCHFKDDQVMAGSLMADGCVQLMQFYLMYLGLHTYTVDARFQPLPDLPQVVRCRGQVTPTIGKLIYRMEITEIGLAPHPYAKANVDILLNGKIIVNFKDLGLQLVEKTPALPMTPRVAALFDERHITEFATGSLAACFGPEYATYDTRRAPRTPNGDLQLISRVLSVNGTRGQVVSGSSLVTEYDVPADAWYFEQNAYPTLPYSILMEIGLQPCGFLSAHLGSTLPYPEENFYFRNLDGNGKYLREVDTRGKTITNHVTLLSSTAIQGIIIQKFTYELSCGGEPFYAGEAAFGYFQPEALINQVGLDRGNSPAPLAYSLTTATKFDLRLPALFTAPDGQPHYRLSGGQLHLLDEVQIVPDGGKFGQGYVYAHKIVNPQDWFFRAHFRQDPVMPGSLGVEAMLQALQAYALHTGLGRDFHSPRFAQAEGQNIVWKYRGQVVPDNHDLSLEIHIIRIETAPGRITIFGEASLWKEALRIYEVKPLALSVVENA
jgi:PfaB family protein